jgi:hypothetical protein
MENVQYLARLATIALIYDSMKEFRMFTRAHGYNIALIHIPSFNIFARWALPLD